MKELIAKIKNTKGIENLNSYIPGLGDDLQILFTMLATPSQSGEGVERLQKNELFNIFHAAIKFGWENGKTDIGKMPALSSEWINHNVHPSLASVPREKMYKEAQRGGGG